MRRFFIVLIIAASAIPANAQEQKEVQLSEVSVAAARIVNRPDGQLITPSRAQVEASSNAYDLLSKLSLPQIRVDDVMHSITALGNRGSVQVRINGAIASKDDLLALDPKSLRNIEFIDNPGVRYGEGIGYVLNLRTKQASSGYTVGLDAVNSLSTWSGDKTIFTKINRGKSELALSYDFTYNDFRGTRVNSETTYWLTDGTQTTISRRDISRRSRSFGNDLQLKYTLADSSNYIFQATLSAAHSNAPDDRREQQMHDADGLFSVLSTDHERQLSPSLDLYFFRKITSRQSVTANLTATHISTTSRVFNNEGSDYRYAVDGKTWSAVSEAIYENRLKPFTLSAGVNYALKYTRNEYSGDVSSLTPMHNSSLYTFAEIKGNAGKFGYVLGLGASRQTYSQGAHDYHFNLFKPKMTLSYAFSSVWKMRFTMEQQGRVSQIAMVSDTRIRQNSMEWNVGNPDIRPVRVDEASLRLSYSKPRLNSSIDVFYRHNAHSNMAHYERTADNHFLYSQRNQGSIDMFYVQNSTSATLIEERLMAYAWGGVYRFLNRGDDYSHYLTTYNIGGGLQLYLGRLTLSASGDNGWRFMEGETWNRQGSALSLSAAYRIGNCRIALHWQHPFEARPTLNKAGLESRYIQRKTVMRGSDYGNMLSLSVSWKIGKGRKYRDIDRSMENRDTQTGIMK